MIGIGGAGMSAIAYILLRMGKKVSGSDISYNGVIERLKGMGAEVYIGHRAENVDTPDVVVVSSAIKDDNPELMEARGRGITILKRIEMLKLISQDRKLIAVTGTHGKTTTTSMTALVFKECNLDPTILIGGELNDIGGNAVLGKGEFVVSEVDESDGSFVVLSPYVQIITNVEEDHLEHYGWDIRNLYDAFVEVAGKVPDDGWVVLCGEHPSASFLQKALGSRGRRIVRYGFKDDMDAIAKDIDFCGIGSEYDFFWREERVGRVRLKIPGIHNVLNSLAVLSLVKLLGLDVDRAFEALSKFRGAHRRFELVGEANGVKVFDDYAHHPSEIEATLRAARNVWPDRRLVVVFQPHRYTRTKALYRGFAKALSIADFVIITDIYPADEAPIEGVSSMLIVDSMRKIGYTNVKYISWGDILDVFSAVKIGDVLFTIGAGNVYKVGESILSRLQEGTDGF